MNRRVLVTGATGFIGHYIVKQLIESGFYVSVLVRKESRHLDTLSAFGQQVQVCWGDINDVGSLELACSGQDAVVHSAAIVSFENGQAGKIMKVNVEGTANMVNVCLEQHINHFIYISSIAALGRLPGQAITDESAVWVEKNASRYSKSKYLAELEVWRGSAEGLNVTILNPSLVLGPWETSHHSMQLFKAANRNLPFYPSGGNGFVDAGDLARAVVLSLQKSVYMQRMIINGHNLSYREVLQKIAHIQGKKGPQWLMPRSMAQLGAGIIRFVAFILGRKHYFQRGVLNSVYSTSAYNNAKSIELLGLQYRSLDHTLNEVIQSYPDRNRINRLE